MCQELKKELERGNHAARKLIKHFETMNFAGYEAANRSIPITTDNGCYIIEIRKTL